MEYFSKFFIDNLFSFIIGGFFTFISYIIGKFYQVFKHSIEIKQKSLELEREEQREIKYGVLGLLRSRINCICTQISSQGFMTIDEKIDLDQLYEAYKNLGGNSKTSIVYEQTISTFEVKYIK